MKNRASPEQLADQEYTAIVIRLLLNRCGQLTHGELVEIQGEPRHPFVGRDGLCKVLYAWLDRQEKRDEPGCVGGAAEAL